MENMGLIPKDFPEEVFCEKRVLVTGHTGFKGSWLSLWLTLLGAHVVGYALPPASEYGNFTLCGMKDRLTDLRGDIRDKKRINEIFEIFQPEMVFHLAAQPIVSKSYRIPGETFETNVAGCVNLLENVRKTESVQSCVIVTSDKCYQNREQMWGYRECDALGGYDPYSASKGCAEIVASSYRKAFGLPVATARAGNVVGGGDWSADRIVPDCIRALRKKESVKVRNPGSVRPWQFVLEPLYGYLLLAAGLISSPEKAAGAWNFGPDSEACVPVRTLVEKVIQLWGEGTWTDESVPDAIHEAGMLSLDCTKAKTLLNWRPRLTLDRALEKTVAWYRSFEEADVFSFCKKQIEEYSACVKNSCESEGKTV